MSDADRPPSAGRTDSLRETYRQQLLSGIGGWSGTVITAIPTVVFVIVNALSTLRWAIAAAVGSAVVLAIYRLIRRQPVQQALTGLIGVVVAALIAGRTGQARGYFLLGIWSSFLYAAVFLVSIVVRRPIVGALWEFLDPTGAPSDETVAEPAGAPADATAGPTAEATGEATGEPGPAPRADEQPAGPPWYRQAPLFRAYLWATTAGTAVFLARGIVQLALFRHNATGWLAFARIAMGYPLYIAAVGFGFWVVTRARRSLAPSPIPADQD